MQPLQIDVLDVRYSTVQYSTVHTCVSSWGEGERVGL